MMTSESTIDIQELNKFAQHAKSWWDPDGPLKTLHDINGTRLEFIQQFGDLKNKKILDVGCGAGILSEALAKAGAEVTGIDAEHSLIQAAKSHAKKNHVNLNYQCSPIEDFESQPFDIIVCMELLEHVSKPELVLEHCQRLIKPQGLLFLSTLSRTLKAYLTAILGAEYILGILPKQTHDYKQFIKPSELCAMARSYDFQLQQMQGLHYNPVTRQASLYKDVSVNYLAAFKLYG